MYTRLITRIETTCYRLGKDDKFQLFVCLSAHDRLLGRIVTDLTKAVAAQQVVVFEVRPDQPVIVINLYSDRLNKLLIDNFYLLIGFLI
jgi:hypothetical protein